eukprot:TRINITY_DN20029_c0_g1_i1.p1 TRINITY_DN20029_c0_g1~~TRINITY_DN20029_c0_g1_i1.p1  ORF type:complete len:303 (+),score=29.06 TRINITY_DN20029_c0_g1_i1:122-1030(+)
MGCTKQLASCCASATGMTGVGEHPDLSEEMDDDVMDSVHEFQPSDAEDEGVDGSGWSYLKHATMQLMPEEDVVEVLFSRSSFLTDDADDDDEDGDDRPVSRLINRIIHMSEPTELSHPFGVSETPASDSMRPPDSVPRTPRRASNSQPPESVTHRASSTAVNGVTRDRGPAKNSPSTSKPNQSSGVQAQRGAHRTRQSAPAAPTPPPAASLTQARFQNPKLPASYKQAAAAAASADDRPESAASRSPHLTPLDSVSALPTLPMAQLPSWAGPSPPASAPSSTLPSPTGRANALAPLRSSTSS